MPVRAGVRLIAVFLSRLAGFCFRKGVNGGPLAPLLEVTSFSDPQATFSEPRATCGDPHAGSFRNPPVRGKREQNDAVARVAAEQGGHVTRPQLLAIGLRKRAIEARLENGQLLRVHRGVYAVGRLPTNPLDQARGALLAAGPRAALSGKSAAAFWGLYTRWAQPLELISPLQRRLPGVNARRSTTLTNGDIRTIGGVRVTSPARTLLEIAPRTSIKLLHRFHNELRMRRLIDNEALIDAAARNAYHPGARHLIRLAGASKGEAKRSPFEVDWVPFAARHGLPAYEMNVHVAGRRVDVLFTPDRLILELDGWGTHGTRQAFEDDREQDAVILAATGIPTIRITRDGLRKCPREQVRRVNAILARR